MLLSVSLIQKVSLFQAGDCNLNAVAVRLDAINAACCDDGQCLHGCSAACSAKLLPFWDECGSVLGEALQQFEPDVVQCKAAQAAPAARSAPVVRSTAEAPTFPPIADQLGVECSDGTPAAECVPPCDEGLHGALLFLSTEGTDAKMTCQLRNYTYVPLLPNVSALDVLIRFVGSRYAWVGASADGGYLGNVLADFLHAIGSGMAGVYSTVLLSDVDHADLLVDKEQVAAVTGDSARPKAPVWHGGEILVAGHASLVLEYVQLGQYAVLEISKLVYGAGGQADSDSYAARYQGSTDYTGHLVGGSLSLAETSLELATLATLKGKLTAGNSLRLSGVTLRDVPGAGLLSGVMVSAVNGGAHDGCFWLLPLLPLTLRRPCCAGRHQAHDSPRLRLAHHGLLLGHLRALHGCARRTVRWPTSGIPS